MNKIYLVVRDNGNGETLFYSGFKSEEGAAKEIKILDKLFYPEIMDFYIEPTSLGE